MTGPTTPAGRVRAYLDEHAQRPRLADRIHCLDSSDGTEHVPLDVSDLRELLDDLWLEPVLRRELAETRAALNALRPSHETPAADEDHQGGNCADIVVSLVGRAMRAEAQRDAAVQHARAEEERAGKLYAALADLTSGAMSRGDAWAVLRETDPIEPSAPVHCTAAQPCEQAGVAGGLRPDGRPHLGSATGVNEPVEPIESLIERSSLGTPEARAARESVPEDTARAIADRVRAAEPGDKLGPDWQQVAVSCRVLAEAVADRQAQASVLGSLASAVLRELAPLSSQPAPADQSEAPSRDELVGMFADYVGAFATAEVIDKLIERGWLHVRDDEGGQG